MGEHDAEALGPGQTNWLASIVADGTAQPEEARQLIAEFVRQVDAGKVDPKLIAHVRDCFAAFLAGKKTIQPSRDAGRLKAIGVPITSLDKAFGLTRVAPGRVPTGGEELVDAAMEVLAI